MTSRISLKVFGGGASVMALVMLGGQALTWLPVASAAPRSSASSIPGTTNLALLQNSQKGSTAATKPGNSSDCSTFTGSGTLWHFVVPSLSASPDSAGPNIVSISATYSGGTVTSTTVVQSGKGINVITTSGATLLDAVATLSFAIPVADAVLLLSHTCAGTSTAPPTTAPPTTAPPTTAPPTTAPPTTAPPTTTPPTTTPPTTTPPTTTPPTTTPPTTTPPTTTTGGGGGITSSAPTPTATQMAMNSTGGGGVITGGSGLPFTGDNTGTLTFWAIVSLLIGLVLMLVGRRSRRRIRS